MARPAPVLPRTLFPLSRYAEMMGYEPTYFWQVKNPVDPPRCTCKIVWFHDARLRLARAILGVERDMKNSLGFGVAPWWEADERQEWLGGYEFISRYGLIVSGGRMVEVALDGGDPVAIAYSDEDGDGVDDWATITVTLTASEAAALAECEVVVYPDGLTVDEIRYLDISIVGTTLTIQGWRSYFVDPQEWYPTKVPNEIRLDDATGKFLEYVDIYRRYHDVTQDAFEIRRTPTTQCGVDGLTETEDAGRVRVIEERLGVLQPILNVCPCWNEWDRVALWYYAGWSASENGACDTFGDLMSEAIVRLTNARLPKQPCGCDVSHERYVEDLKIVEGSLPEFGRRMSPFGNRMGEVFAWEVVKQLRTGKGSSL